ncbi:MAG TPA: glycosyl hydrolase family 79 C-terminal domain-containing protein, partial [Verrucomicrobiae bacterium]|nr:glycosyl hydrolase family 79 C-terminal domain-containing protein [Verrucomicrobiae bacterium]
NEPDVKRVYNQDLTITNFATYLEKWRTYASAITNAVPGAKFAGPDAGSGNVYWTTNFAGALKDSGIISVVTEHYYAGGKGRGVEAMQGIDAMLSREWIKASQTLYNKMAKPVLWDGFPIQFTEANDHYSGGVHDASDTFAGALWALDFLHWWAAAGVRGVDFHNTQWVVNDVITREPGGRLAITPKGYGIKAFDLGGHGVIEPVALSNPDGINLTAYAVGDTGSIFVTLINKDHGADARGAAVSIVSEEIGPNAEVIFLNAPGGDVTAKTGVTLGGASITSDGPWLGKWTPLAPGKVGKCVLTVPAACAAIVKISKNEK